MSNYLIIGSIVAGSCALTAARAYYTIPDVRHCKWLLEKTETIAITRGSDPSRHMLTTNIFGDKQEWYNPCCEYWFPWDGSSQCVYQESSFKEDGDVVLLPVTVDEKLFEYARPNLPRDWEEQPNIRIADLN